MHLKNKGQSITLSPKPGSPTCTTSSRHPLAPKNCTAWQKPQAQEDPKPQGKSDAFSFRKALEALEQTLDESGSASATSG